MSDFTVPLIIRGEIIEDYEIVHHDRSATGRSFSTPSAAKYINQIVAKSPAILTDLYTISFEEILDYLDELSDRLDLDTNKHWREAFEVSCYSSNLSRAVLENVYRQTPGLLKREVVREIAEARIGIEYLEGWVPKMLRDGRRIEVRAVGSRAAHVIAGNVPIVAITTLMRSVITRNDAIVKVPSNDPLTMGALARTMIEMAPNHPLTKHVTVAYWKGGDEKVEEKVYQPRHIEKLIAWGGFASIKHITKYLQPGIDLITLDPKSSTTLIGREAMQDEVTMRAVAQRVAADIGGWDQEACVNARVIFLESGTDKKGIDLANRFGRHVYDALQTLPQTTSGMPVKFDLALKHEIQAIAQQKDFYNIICDGPIERTGAVIVSQFDEQVDFPKLLYGRVANLVPMDNIDKAVSYFTASTQTVGVYPPALTDRIRDIGAIMGGQMFVPVGYAIAGTPVGPQDGIEPERRMCRWIIDTRADPAVVPGPWMHEDEVALLSGQAPRSTKLAAE